MRICTEAVSSLSEGGMPERICVQLLVCACIAVADSASTTPRNATCVFIPCLLRDWLRDHLCYGVEPWLPRLDVRSMLGTPAQSSIIASSSGNHLDGSATTSDVWRLGTVRSGYHHDWSRD